jgi:hypothetical protein
VQVDSASTPHQLSRLLDDVKEAGAKRVLLVFGCPGRLSAQERKALTAVRRGGSDLGRPPPCCRRQLWARLCPAPLGA